MISPIPGATPTVPGSATRALPGIQADVVDRDGNSVGDDEGGLLIRRRPSPAMLRTVHGNDARLQAGYLGQFGYKYLAGHGARRVESALVSHPDVTEAAVVARPDDLKGQAIVAFVTRENDVPTADLENILKQHVVHEIGAIARPAEIRFTPALPKTRSGKIMRRLLADIAAGRAPGDTTTLEDAKVLDSLKAQISADPQED